MGTGTAVGILIIVLAGALGWLLIPSPSRQARSQPEDLDEVELQAAEDEVRDLDAFGSPEDADDELQDWGPGAPRQGS